MRALRPACEFALAALAVAVVILLARGLNHDARPASVAASLHDPRTCRLCLHPLGRVKLMTFPGSEIVSPPPRVAGAGSFSLRP